MAYGMAKHLLPLAASLLDKCCDLLLECSKQHGKRQSQNAQPSIKSLAI